MQINKKCDFNQKAQQKETQENSTKAITSEEANDRSLVKSDLAGQGGFQVWLNAGY